MPRETAPAPGRARPAPPPDTTPVGDRLAEAGRRLARAALARARLVPLQTWITFGVVFAAVVFTFLQLSPSLLFTNTTPAGGDTGAHVWGPDFIRHHLLPHLRLTGWAPSWYAGFPAFVFYFPLPALLIALLSFVLPYGVAFKLVTVLGLLSLPVAAWAFGRLAGMRFPGPALLAVATVPFLFDRGFTIYGGNIASTLAGEFAFSISLSLALVFLGVLARGLDTGRHRAWAAVLLALTGLCHLLPTLFALAGAGVLFLLRPGRARARFVVTVLAVGALLAAFWSLPFLLRLPYTNNMGWGKVTEYTKNLFTDKPEWLLVLAALGTALSVVFRRRTGLALVGMAVVSGAAFLVAPEGKLWNARALPFWYLCLYLLAGVAVAEVAILVGRLLSEDPKVPYRPVVLGAPLVGALVVWLVVGLPLGVLPGWVPKPDTHDQSFIPAWAKWNYSGYERKAAYPEYKGIIDTMAQVGRTEGCGRAHWEYESDLNRFGTPMALMLLPFWTHGCIDSMEGLYFESSATTPYHFLTAAELSKAASDPQRDLPYGSLDVARGVQDLQLLGSRYFLAFSPAAVEQAKADRDLREVATTGNWHVFEVAGAELVSPLSFKPAVEGGGKPWLDVSVAWFNDPSRRQVPLAASGPEDWPRVQVKTQKTASATVGSDVVIGPTPAEPVEPARVTNIKEGDDHLSFDVDRVGSPVLVKTSYFPNWKASGAKGPWRVTPNLMVVVPTSKHVSMHFGYTPVDVGGWLLTFVGIGLVVALARRGPVDFGDPPAAIDLEGEEPAGKPLAAAADVESDDPGGLSPGPLPPVGVPDRGT